MPSCQYPIDERAHLILINDAIKGLEDVVAGKTTCALEVINEMRQKRKNQRPTQMN